MFSIVDALGVFWTFHGATTSQMMKWWHELDKMTQLLPDEDDLLGTSCDSRQPDQL